MLLVLHINGLCIFEVPVEEKGKKRGEKKKTKRKEVSDKEEKKNKINKLEIYVGNQLISMDKFIILQPSKSAHFRFISVSNFANNPIN